MFSKPDFPVPIDPAHPDVKPQYAALCYRVVKGKPQVLLITSRGTKRWIVPKGWPMDHCGAGACAAQEAWEEAGVEGDIDHEPIGSYWLPVTEERPAPIEVKLYPLRVARQREDWKERGQRYRHWAVLPEAKRLITHEGLADVAVALAQRELGSGRHHDTPSVAITE